jgi:hypothetical protein
MMWVKLGDAGWPADTYGAADKPKGVGMPDHISLEDAAQGSVSDREETVRKVNLRYDAIHKWAHPIHVSERLVREVAARYENN